MSSSCLPAKMRRYRSGRGRYVFPYVFDASSSCLLAKMRHCESGGQDIHPPAFEAFKLFPSEEALLVRRGEIYTPRSC
jgi:hypothetical protein